MNENFDEKNSGKEQILSDEVLAKIAGGEIDEDWIFNGSYVCPLCGQNHRFRFVIGDLWLGYHYDILDEGNHCEKISHLRRADSVNFNTKTGIIEMETTEGHRVSAVFFIVGM